MENYLIKHVMPNLQKDQQEIAEEVIEQVLEGEVDPRSKAESLFAYIFQKITEGGMTQQELKQENEQLHKIINKLEFIAQRKGFISEQAFDAIVNWHIQKTGGRVA